MTAEQCGAWGGCPLPAGHNLGRVDLPENHQAPARTKIRITLERAERKSGWSGRPVPAKTVVKDFADPAEAAAWFVEDSYFSESYTLRATWERIPDDAEGESR